MILLPEQHVEINSLCQIYLKILLSNLEKNTTMPEETDMKHTLQLFFYFFNERNFICYLPENRDRIDVSHSQIGCNISNIYS